MKNVLIVLTILLLGCSERSKLKSILSEGSATFQETLTSENHEVQIIYGEIDSDTIIHHIYGDTSQYFYPASSIKILNVFTSVQWLNEKGLSINTVLKTDSSEHHPRSLFFDSLFQDSIMVKNLIQKIFVYSDNQASNILYNLMGKDYINNTLSKLGVKSRIIHQLGESAFAHTPESNSWTFKGTVKDEDEVLELESTKQHFISNLNPQNQKKGKGYINQYGELIQEPFDFTVKNYVPVSSLLCALERVIKPEVFDEDQRFSFKESDQNELIEIMKLRPKDLPNPIDTLADNYVKFLVYGDAENTNYPETVTIMNKVGWAYGYLTDIAYFRDSENNIEFFLAATIHVNENQIFNDGIYEYDSVGLPFLGELGRLVYEYELNSR
ncbi:serine hydrolase [Ekhidna sp.]|uniref:serine hydrolase n=1 Tax=Ekhidna sp. TaxID=2608089 RepID=UPI003B50D516